MLNKKAVYAVVAGASFIGLSACNTLPVITDVNPEMSVANCHTYTFAQEHMANTGQPAAYGNPLNAERLRVAIESNLAAKGIQRVSDRGASPECVVGYAMGSRQVFDDYYGGFGMGWGYGGRGRRFGGGWGYDDPWVRDETRITIDLFDAKSRKPIWHASVSQYGADLIGPNAQAKISAAAAAIFTKFPVGVTVPAGGRTTT